MTIAHWFVRLACAGALGALALTGCGDATENTARAERESELKPVLTVDKVTMERLAKTPPALTLKAEGTANTAGWSDISLEPAMIEGDTLTYRLMGKPPEGMSAQVLTPVTASRLVDPLPEGVVKIRVKAAQNETVEPVPPATEE